MERDILLDGQTIFKLLSGHMKFYSTLWCILSNSYQELLDVLSKICLTATSLGVLTFTFTQSSWVAGGILYKKKPFRKHGCQLFVEEADQRVKPVKEKGITKAWTEERKMEDRKNLKKWEVAHAERKDKRISFKVYILF